VTAAFVYLTLCSVRNSVRLRLRRLRQARYLLIGLGLVLYFGSMLWNRPRSGILLIPPAYREQAEVVAIAVAAVMLGLAWVLPTSLALQFTSAEVQLLFPAPITRRQLISYKLSRQLLGVVSTSLFFAMFMAPPRLVPAAGFAVRTFVILAVMAFYQTGVSLYRKNAEERARPQSARRIAVPATALIALPAVAWVLTRVAFAPVGELLYVLPLAAALLIAGWLWVVRSDSNFEEAAAEAAEQLRLTNSKGYSYSRRPPVRANRSSSYRLAPIGPIESAILWKNWMLITRPSRAVIVVITVLLVGLVVGVSATEGVARGRSLFGILSFVAAGVCVLLGPMGIRGDLRQDLAQLAIIKTWPVRGAAVFRGELLAPMIALSLGAAVPILLGCTLDDKMLLNPGASPALRAGFAVAAVLVASTVILAQLVIQNGIAVTFPGWVRIIPGGSMSGVEVTGQMMITLYGGLFALMLSLIVPAGAAAAAWFLAGRSWTAPLIPSAVFAVILVVECAAATEVFGRILDHADLQDVAIVE
jgi:ABC-2 type transport system permease protein